VKVVAVVSGAKVGAGVPVVVVVVVVVVVDRSAPVVTVDSPVVPPAVVEVVGGP